MEGYKEVVLAKRKEWQLSIIKRMLLDIGMSEDEAEEEAIAIQNTEDANYD